jgi:hypothetical protein
MKLSGTFVERAVNGAWFALIMVHKSSSAPRATPHQNAHTNIYLARTPPGVFLRLSQHWESPPGLSLFVNITVPVFSPLWFRVNSPVANQRGIYLIKFKLALELRLIGEGAADEFTILNIGCKTYAFPHLTPLAAHSFASFV